MRLTASQIETIQDTVQHMLGTGAAVSVFGSRLDEHRRGGDVDLLIEAERQPDLLQRASLKNQLEQRLQLPVDLVTASFDQPSAFARVAKAQAVRLSRGLLA